MPILGLDWETKPAHPSHRPRNGITGGILMTEGVAWQIAHVRLFPLASRWLSG